MMATEAAPARQTSGALAREIPPIATMGRVAWAASRASSAVPTTGPGFSFELVPKIGPSAR
jgi:hypothetical protein